MSAPRSPWSGRTEAELVAASAGYGNQDQMEVDSAASELMAWGRLLKEQEGAP